MSSDDKSRKAFFKGKRAAALLAEFDPARVPAHVAVITDGNGRWASKRGLPKLAGHSAGAKAVREAIAASIELGLSYLTIYSFSSENWKRPKDEVSGLMSLFVEVLERELTNLERMDVRVVVIGAMDQLPEATRAAMAQTWSISSSCGSGYTPHFAPCEQNLQLRAQGTFRAELAMLSLGRAYVNRCGARGGRWISGLHLLWWTRPDSVPPLVTTSPVGTAPEASGVLGQGIDGREIAMRRTRFPKRC